MSKNKSEIQIRCFQSLNCNTSQPDKKVFKILNSVKCIRKVESYSKYINLNTGKKLLIKCEAKLGKGWGKALALIKYVVSYGNLVTYMNDGTTL